MGKLVKHKEAVPFRCIAGKPNKIIFFLKAEKYKDEYSKTKTSPFPFPLEHLDEQLNVSDIF